MPPFLSRALCLGALVLATAATASVAVPDATVTVDNFTFGPNALTVPAGTRVVWTNQDDIPHKVVEDADVRRFKSPALDTGDSFSFVFAQPGTYHYFCSLHPRMQGTVVVR
jgi:plastocyanin